MAKVGWFCAFLVNKMENVSAQNPCYIVSTLSNKQVNKVDTLQTFTTFLFNRSGYLILGFSFTRAQLIIHTGRMSNPFFLLF